MKTIFVKPKNVIRKWYLLNAYGKPLGRVAVKAVNLLRGKHKPFYTPHQEIGDFVIIVNADKVVLTGNKRQKKLYYSYSGYPGGLRVESFNSIIARKPVFPMEMAVKGMLPKGPLGRKLYRNVKIYADATHPHEAQKPERIEI
ncbi:MAG: 50S ribosomal protein L13 [Spirochaetota bacterium]